MTEKPPMVQDPRNVVEITQRLVQIPSYVYIKDESGEYYPENKRVDEQRMGEYVAEFLQIHTNLDVRKEQVANGRFNVIAANSDTPKLVLLGHTDTVKPTVGGEHSSFDAEIQDGKIYGLGSSDMKSGLASILSAAALYKDVPDVMLAFYIDEEYDFAGMRALVKNYGDIRPQLLFSADGDDLQIGHGCRGLVEVHGVMRGKSAHASRPDQGINAITGTVDATRDLINRLGVYTHPALGKSSVNLARLDGGKAAQDEETGKLKVVEQINAVPDISKFKIDIRTSSPDINGRTILKQIEDYCRSNNLTLEDLKIQHDLGAWYTPIEDINLVIPLIRQIVPEVKLRDVTSTGFIDLQMIWDAIGRPPALTFGPAIGRLAHQRDEYVEINDLLKARDVFGNVMSSFKQS